MDINQIGSLIGTLGFPIVACCAMFWYFIKKDSKNTEAINNNTIAINKLLDKLQ